MGLETSSGFNRSRFHLDLFLAASEGKGEGEEKEPYGQHTETLDDEHTPGIFVVSKLARGGRGSEKSDPGRIGSEIFMTRPGLTRVKKTGQTYFI